VRILDTAYNLFVKNGDFASLVLEGGINCETAAISAQTTVIENWPKIVARVQISMLLANTELEAEVTTIKRRITTSF
jgi:hypothetical protein